MENWQKNQLCWHAANRVYCYAELAFFPNSVLHHCKYSMHLFTEDAHAELALMWGSFKLLPRYFLCWNLQAFVQHQSVHHCQTSLWRLNFLSLFWKISCNLTSAEKRSRGAERGAGHQRLLHRLHLSSHSKILQLTNHLGCGLLQLTYNNHKYNLSQKYWTTTFSLHLSWAASVSAYW